MKALKCKTLGACVAVSANETVLASCHAAHRQLFFAGLCLLVATRMEHHIMNLQAILAYAHCACVFYGRPYVWPFKGGGA